MVYIVFMLLGVIATLHKYWQERYHPFRVEYELPIELY